MDLLELAKKWLTPRRFEIQELEAADFAERGAFIAEVSKIWLEYHAKNEAWARAKLAAGLKLTPEALEYMQREILFRRAQAADAAKVKKEIQDEQDAANGNPGRSQQPSNGGGDRPTAGGGGESGGGSPRTSDGLDASASAIAGRTESGPAGA